MPFQNPTVALRKHWHTPGPPAVGFGAQTPCPPQMAPSPSVGQRLSHSAPTYSRWHTHPPDPARPSVHAPCAHKGQGEHWGPKKPAAHDAQLAPAQPVAQVHDAWQRRIDPSKLSVVVVGGEGQ